MPGPLDRDFAAWRAMRIAFMALSLIGVVLTLVLLLGGKKTAGVPGVPVPSINTTCNSFGLCPPSP